MSGDPVLRQDPPGDEPPRWMAVLWWALSRIGVFAAGARLALTEGASETHVVAGATLMMVAGGFAVAGWPWRGS